MAEPGGTRALENSGNYTTERGGNDRAEMGWKLTTEPGWIKNGIRTEKTGRKCSQRDYPHEQLWSCRKSRDLTPCPIESYDSLLLGHVTSGLIALQADELHYKPKVSSIIHILSTRCPNMAVLRHP